MNPLLIAPVVTGVCAAVKAAGLPGKYIPLLAGALGIALGLITNGQDLQSAVDGLLAGLGAVGVYEAGKNAFAKK